MPRHGAGSAARRGSMMRALRPAGPPSPQGRGPDPPHPSDLRDDGPDGGTMALVQRMQLGVAAALLAACAAAPAGATTLVRASLDDLVAANTTVVLGEVADVSSRWNADGSFMMTDVHVVVQDVLKGDKGTQDVKLTLMGGAIGDLTTLIVAGAELVPGRQYVLFLGRGDLPGEPGALTV